MTQPKNQLTGLPSLLARMRTEMHTEAGVLADRVHAAHERGMAAIARAQSQVKADEASIEEIERFTEEMEAVVGGNRGPSLGGSVEPSPPVPKAAAAAAQPPAPAGEGEKKTDPVSEPRSDIAATDEIKGSE